MNYSEAKIHLQKKKYKWLITGVAGFIGSNLLEELLNLKQDIVGIDNFSSGKKENIINVKKNVSNLDSKFDFIEGDICNYDTCSAAFENIDFVLHQAARGSVIRSIEDPISTNQSNISGFLNIIQASYKSNVSKFIYASSSSVYGDHKGLPKIENKIGNPISPYAVTKYTNELYAEVFSRLYKIETIGFRYFNVFGRRQDPNGHYAAVIPKWVDASINHKPIQINGDGKTSRDFCYVDNAVQANILAALNKSNNMSEIYNVACNKQTTLNELIDMIKLILNNKKIINKIDSNITYQDFRTGDIRHSLADISKAIKNLEYSPHHDIYSGLESYIEWYLKEMDIKY